MMQLEYIMTFLTVLLGSSVGAALVTSLFHWWSSRKERQIQALDGQLRGLYGPLNYFTSLNESLFYLYEDYHKAYDKEFSGEKFAEQAKEVVQKEAVAFLEEANSYIRGEVQENNRHVIDILQQNWHLIDPDDVEHFSKFQIDMSRLKRTGEQNGSTSFNAHHYLGPISYMRPDMIHRVREKFEKKQKKYRKLTGQ
jgi:hypothetical protein